MSIGCSEWKHGEEFDEVYRRADEIMYNNKRYLKELKAGGGIPDDKKGIDP